MANSGGRFTKKQELGAGFERMVCDRWQTRERERERGRIGY